MAFWSITRPTVRGTSIHATARVRSRCAIYFWNSSQIASFVDSLVGRKCNVCGIPVSISVWVRVTVQSMTCSHRFRLCHTHSVPILYMAKALWRSAMSLRTFSASMHSAGRQPHMSRQDLFWQMGSAAANALCRQPWLRLNTEFAVLSFLLRGPSRNTSISLTYRNEQSTKDLT